MHFGNEGAVRTESLQRMLVGHIEAPYRVVRAPAQSFGTEILIEFTHHVVRV